MKIECKKSILAIKNYTPGKPIKEVEKEYGIKNSVKLASNENPLGTSKKALAALKFAIKDLNRYPANIGLIKKLAFKYNVRPENIVLGNGSDELLKMFADSFLSCGDEAIMTNPSFLIYDIVVKSAGASSIFVPLNNLKTDFKAIKNRITSATRIIFLTNPNNPTGAAISDEEFKNFIFEIPKNILVVIDEAYIEFVRDKSSLNGLSYINEELPIAVTRTFSKAYGLAGLRIGYSIMPIELALILNKIRLPFNVNSLAHAAALAALDDEDFLNKTIALIHKEIDFVSDQLESMKIKFFPTQANFLLIDVKKDADKIFKEMLKQGVIVRSMHSYGYPNYIRVNAGLRKENLKFLEAVKKVVNGY